MDQSVKEDEESTLMIQMKQAKRIEEIITYSDNVYRKENKESVFRKTKEYATNALSTAADLNQGLSLQIDAEIKVAFENLDRLDVYVQGLIQHVHSCTAEVAGKNAFFDKGSLAPDPIQRQVIQLEKPVLEPFNYEIDFSRPRNLQQGGNRKS